jgi:hypothetical protein
MPEGTPAVMFRMLLCAMVLPTVEAHAQRTRALEALAYRLEGTHVSAVDSTTPAITLQVVRLWHKQRDGAWLYVEEGSMDTVPSSMRQQVFQLQQQDDSTFTCAVYDLPVGPRWRGHHQDPMTLVRLRPDSLLEVAGCDMIFHVRGTRYVAVTSERSCPDGTTPSGYVSREMEVSSTAWSQHERVFDARGRVIASRNRHFVEQQR